MEIKELYQSSDGRLFQDEDLCIKHELSLSLKKISNIKFFNDSKELIDTSESLAKAYDNFRKVIIPTKEDYDNLMELFDFLGYDMNLFPSEGTYYSIDESGTVISEGEFINKIRNLESYLNLK